MNTIRMAIWLSRILRWGLGIYFMIWAHQHEEATALYFIGGAFFITGFLNPKSCVNGACLTDAVPKKYNNSFIYEEIK